MKSLKVEENVPNGTNIEKMKFMLNPDNLKKFCEMLEDMLEERKNLLYDKVTVESNQRTEIT